MTDFKEKKETEKPAKNNNDHGEENRESNSLSDEFSPENDDLELLNTDTNLREENVAEFLAKTNGNKASATEKINHAERVRLWLVHLRESAVHPLAFRCNPSCERGTNKRWILACVTVNPDLSKEELINIFMDTGVNSIHPERFDYFEKLGYALFSLEKEDDVLIACALRTPDFRTVLLAPNYAAQYVKSCFLYPKNSEITPAEVKKLILPEVIILQISKERGKNGYFFQYYSSYSI
jgi:hypothetical protein